MKCFPRFYLLSNKLFLCGIILATYLAFSCNEEEPVPEGPEGKDLLISYSPVAVSKTNATKVYVHYMPWFETKETNPNGQWGIHWTMSNCNPDNMDNAGKRNIASHYYPLIGPYASSDPDVIEYHLLLMKYAGIDGVIVDWYGSYDVNDFGSNRKNTEALIDKLDEVGLQFAVTYEDWTTNTVTETAKAPDKLTAAKTDMAYLQDNYFSNPQYIHINNKPLLTIFGPQQIQTEAEWTTLFSILQPAPVFLTLWYESGDAGSNATGEFSWVYENNSHIDNFYSNRYNSFSVAMGSAYPGFRHYYNEGGWPSSINWEIEHLNGETYRQTLAKASNKKPKYLQLVTWNDFGEGTMIEPTQEFEYLFLEETQKFAGVTFDKSILQTIYSLYQLRKKYTGNTGINNKLDQAFYYLVSLQTDEATILIDSLLAAGN